MPAMLLRVRVWIQRRLQQLLLTAALVGVAAGLVMGLAAGTRRTDSAPDRYTRQFGGDPDLVFTQQQGRPLTDQVAELDGVSGARSIAFIASFPISPMDGSPVIDPNPFAGDNRVVGARLVEGRFPGPDQPDEFTVNRTFADILRSRFGTRVGDVFEMTSFDQQQVAANAFDTGEPPAVPSFPVTLVGVFETPGDFDDPSPTMLFPHSFLTAHPTVGVAQTIVAADLDAGVDAATVMDAVHQLPDGADAFATPTRVVSEDARRAVRFQVTALWIVTAIAVLAACVVIIQIVGRMARVGEDERAALIALGWRSLEIAVERAVEASAAALLALPIAVVLEFGLTAAFPLGELRIFEPEVGARMDWAVAALGVLGVVIVVAVGAVVVGRRRVRVDESIVRVGRLSGLVAASGAGMPLSTGAGMVASGPRGRRSVGALLPAMIGLAGLVGAVVVGLSLTHIVDKPARWGVNYDQLFGNPYIPTDQDIVTPVLNNPDVVAVTGASLGSLTINGVDTSTFAVDAAKGDLVPTAIRGRSPSTDDEIGVGAEVARRLHVGVGDEVEVVGSSGTPRTVRVVGIVVTPLTAGNGATMTFDGYVALTPTATENILLVNFRDGAPADVVDAVQAANFSPPGTLIKPTSVRALERVTAAPFLLGIVLTVLLAVGCTYLLATSVRARRRDLAVLRALGSDRRQLRAIIHWQATLTTVFVLAVGVPVGVVAGRWIVQLLTDALGIVPGADVPLLGVVGIVGGTLLFANLLALLPARQAARANITLLTRDS